MLTLARRGADGFTLIEIIVALVILLFIVLGSAFTTGTLARQAAEAEMQAMALQAAESRISVIRMDSRYADLEGIYEGAESELPGLPGFTRETDITRVQAAGAGGLVRDYQRILVIVSGPFLGSPITRQIVLAAP